MIHCNIMIVYGIRTSLMISNIISRSVSRDHHLQISTRSLSRSVFDIHPPARGFIDDRKILILILIQCSYQMVFCCCRDHCFEISISRSVFKDQYSKHVTRYHYLRSLFKDQYPEIIISRSVIKLLC